MAEDVKSNLNLKAFFVKKKDRKVDLKNVKKFLDDILSGKIDNKYDAEKEYLEKINYDKDLLYTKEGPEDLKNIFNDSEHSVLGILLPLKEKKTRHRN